MKANDVKEFLKNNGIETEHIRISERVLENTDTYFIIYLEDVTLPVEHIKELVFKNIKKVNRNSKGLVIAGGNIFPAVQLDILKDIEAHDALLDTLDEKINEIKSKEEKTILYSNKEKDIELCIFYYNGNIRPILKEGKLKTALPYGKEYDIASAFIFAERLQKNNGIY